MLKNIRRGVAAIVFVLITLLLLDFTGAVHLWFGWLAEIQLIPAILAVNAAVVIGLVLLTFVFGRIYCSAICPLGILQDGISHLSGGRKGQKNRFRYSKAKSWLRYATLVVFIVALMAGISVIASLLDPYAAYGRIAANLFAPVYRLGNNLLAWFAESANSYAFYPTEVWVKSWITLGVAAATLLIIAILAWRHGRTYCNTICPVGSLLGLVSRFSIFKPTFDTEKCTKCGLCERGCKSSCIDSKNMTIDQSRCVTCFNCIDRCNFGAMKYTPRKRTKKSETVNAISPNLGAGKEGVSRRGFLAIAGTLAVGGTLRAQQLHVDGGLAEIEDKKIPDRKVPIVPPGAKAAAHLKQHCTACQLCVSACPNNILRPSSKLATLMQPEMSYERGYCRPECTECSQVCPTRAIGSITTAEKSAISIGYAVWIKENCVVNRDNVPCDSCHRHCPTGAIMLVGRDPDKENSLKIPIVDKELCIGCGACEYLCPARPFSAIYVEGNVKHHSV
ncbi:4Fe-4S binding protein [uncultured Alistipes sp.]|jgi:4Fe-4S binding domain|uniref:4Fe-4S binding protein n=1 Tax=uncultured Alistipes sp. TaxID=538949 RepID=UPI0025DA44E2|nr:4Fe-4S binding protein [uncultured Alistipes sp.]